LTNSVTSEGQTFSFNETVMSLAFSPDGKYLLAGGGEMYACNSTSRPCVAGEDSQNGTAQLWDRQSGKLKYTLPGHTGPVRGVAFSPNGRYVLTGSQDGT